MRFLLLSTLTAMATTDSCAQCFRDLRLQRVEENIVDEKAAATCATLCRAAEAPTCTGSADAVAPACYSGSIAYGAETLGTYIKDFKAGSGHMDVSGSGMITVNCTDHKFTKSGQEISVNVTDCVEGVQLSDVKYCSDQDISVLTLSYIGVDLTATLKRSTPCPPSALE